jgi:hypothetical protein
MIASDELGAHCLFRFGSCNSAIAPAFSPTLFCGAVDFSYALAALSERRALPLAGGAGAPGLSARCSANPWAGIAQ